MPVGTANTIKRILILIATVLIIASCGGVGGGGGGGGEETDNYLGYTDFQVEQDSLDSGDVTAVTLTVYDMHKDGVLLKFHYPSSLKFQSGSALIYSGDADSWQKTTPLATLSTDSGKYLVFALSRPSEDESNRVAIYFNMKAVSSDQSAYIEVDLDNDDPTVPDSQEFSASDPQFSNDDRWNISIDGQAAAGTATPTPTAAPAE